MTRLPSDSFLPSGAMEADPILSLAGLAGSPSSVVSPLSLPGGVHYFDVASRPSVTSHPTQAKPHHTNRRPSRDPPQAQPASFLSPHLTPIPSHTRYRLPISRSSQQRAASLSPTRYPIGKRRDGAMEMNPARPPLEVIPSGKPVSSDTIPGTGSGLITVRRSFMRTDPTAGTVTQPAEQGYRRLENLRQVFDNERKHLQADRDRAEEVHKEILGEMEQDHARERAQWETDKYELQKQIVQLQSRLKEVEAGSHPNLAAFQSGLARVSPLERASLSPSNALDRSSIDSTLAMDDKEPTKVIDVHEYHKDLEGIHLKENFVKRETFTDTPSSAGSRASSGKVSPPQVPEDSKSLARANTILALKADASKRLTMHAGHTPTVSLSVAHTGMTNTVTSSGSNTPTLTSGDGAMSSDGNDKSESCEPSEPIPTCVNDQDPDIMESLDEDPELKRPLTLRNMPAKDEIFLARLDDRLEKVTSGEDATPTVLKHSDDEEDDFTENSTEKVEADIPLKIKQTSSNFGKPFGQA